MADVPGIEAQAAVGLDVVAAADLPQAGDARRCHADDVVVVADFLPLARQIRARPHEANLEHVTEKTPSADTNEQGKETGRSSVPFPVGISNTARWQFSGHQWTEALSSLRQKVRANRGQNW